MTRTDTELERMYGIQADRFIIGMMTYASNIDTGQPIIKHPEVAILLNYVDYCVQADTINATTNLVLDKIIVSQ